MAVPERRTEDGFVMQLAVNHLGHFVLTARLLAALLRSAAPGWSRVASTGRHAGALSTRPTRTCAAGWRLFGVSQWRFC
jgi:NAD(P)-dependent dehydrogenase (short-subunit alcohol dehydrogenase family)